MTKQMADLQNQLLTLQKKFDDQTMKTWEMNCIYEKSGAGHQPTPHESSAISFQVHTFLTSLLTFYQ